VGIATVTVGGTAVAVGALVGGAAVLVGRAACGTPPQAGNSTRTSKRKYLLTVQLSFPQAGAELWHLITKTVYQPIGNE
jgi:Cu/Ag efflux pump CusA